MEMQRREVVTVGKVECERGRPLAVVTGLTYCLDLGDGEVDGLFALWRRQGLEGRGGEGRGGAGRGKGREGRVEGRGGQR